MTTPDPLYKITKISALNISKRENQLLEFVLLVSIQEELKIFLEHTYKKSYRVIITASKMENRMFNDDFIPMIIKDILASGEYSLEGIARYTHTHPDVIDEIFIKCSENVSLSFLRKLIELHRSVRNDLYETIIRKFVQKNMSFISSESTVSAS